MRQLAAPYSVLMPLAPWESPANVKEALESLRSQTCQPTQVVVSCDGAPSGDLRLVLERSGLPLDVVVGPGLEGVGPVLARGLPLCEQEFVIRADADDISVPERCEKQIEWLIEHPEGIALGSRITEFTDGDELVCGCREIPVGPSAVMQWARSRNPINHPSAAIRKSVVLAAGSYRSKPGFEDYDLWLRLLARYGAGAVANLPESLVWVRVGPAHLARRHGCRYALAELRFFWACGRERLLAWPDVLLALLLRMPLRLLPASVLARVMARTRSGNLRQER